MPGIWSFFLIVINTDMPPAACAVRNLFSESKGSRFISELSLNELIFNVIYNFGGMTSLLSETI